MMSVEGTQISSLFTAAWQCRLICIVSKIYDTLSKEVYKSEQIRDFWVTLRQRVKQDGQWKSAFSVLCA